MHQYLSFSQLEYANQRKVMRRDRFLAEMEQVVPWVALLEEVRPFYSQKHNRGHRVPAAQATAGRITGEVRTKSGRRARIR